MSSLRDSPGYVLDERDAVAVLEKLAARFGVSDELAGLRLTRVWESRTSFLHKMEAPPDDAARSDKAVVLKVGKEWTVDKAREVHEDLSFLHHLWGEHEDLRLNVPRVYGWLEDPACVCIEFVEGEDLSQALSRRDGYLSAEVESAFERCGAALGLFHSAELVDLSSPDAPCSEDELRRRLENMARWFLVRSRPIAAADLDGAVSRRYGDFAPYNLRLTPDGGVCVLDQLSSRSYAPIHRDVSWFLHRIGLRIGRYDHEDSRKHIDAAQERLEALFMAGYASTGPRRLDSPADQALLALYRAYKTLRTSRKRVRERQFRGLPRLLALTLRWRRRAMQGPPPPARDRPS